MGDVDGTGARARPRPGSEPLPSGRRPARCCAGALLSVEACGERELTAASTTGGGREPRN